jgi:transcriptional repressor NrdR
LKCGHRFTTYERLEEVPLYVVKRTGDKELFDRAKIISGLQSAAKGRPVEDSVLIEIAERVEDDMRLTGDDVTSNQVGHAVLSLLRSIDEVTYMRFASVYKNFDAAADFNVNWLCSKKSYANSKNFYRFLRYRINKKPSSSKI